jgi:hypothetical protein
MSNQKQKEAVPPAPAVDGAQNSYQKHSPQAGEHAPDIQQPGPAGDFGGGAPAPKPAPADRHELARRQKGKADATHPEEAAEPSNPYAGT